MAKCCNWVTLIFVRVFSSLFFFQKEANLKKTSDTSPILLILQSFTGCFLSGHQRLFDSVWDEYSNIRIYWNIFGRIYSFAKIFVIFFLSKFIWIFICDIFILTNIFGYAFFHYLWGLIYLSFNLFTNMVQMV